MNGSYMIFRLLEVPMSLAAILLFVLTWRITRIGGFGLLALVRGFYLLQMLAISLLGLNGGGSSWMFISLVGLVLDAVAVFAVWNIYTHMKRIWAPVETPPSPPPPAS
jgi:hypothetical protein